MGSRGCINRRQSSRTEADPRGIRQDVVGTEIDGTNGPSARPEFEE